MASATSNKHPALRRLAVPLSWLAAIVTAWVIFPPFHVRRLASDSGAANAPAATAAAFDARSYAETFWNHKLLAAASQATDLNTVLTALARNSTAAEQYGRRTGLGGKPFYFVRGAGRVSSIDRKGVWLSVDDPAHARVLLISGPIFGNALRDATGLLDIKNFTSFDFNALSTELNRLAETKAQPGLQRAVVGERVRFTGCAESEGNGDKLLLKVVPISVEHAS
jgi:predicted lipoprotein